MQLEYAVKSDIGRVRDNNEDTALLNLQNGIFLICDGFGEGSYGKVASSLSGTTILRYFEHIAKNRSMPFDLHPDANAAHIVSAVHLANLRLYNFVDRYIDYYGMGSTIASLYLNNGNAYVAHVGDSRVYLLRDKTFKLLTSDHSYVNELLKLGRIREEEVSKYVNKHFITRSLGMAESIRVDLNIHDVQKDDMFMICSDGLNHMVPDAKIYDIIRMSTTMQDACARLIRTANDMGGEDDISVVLVRVAELDEEDKHADTQQGISYLNESDQSVLTEENSMLETIFGEELYPREIQLS